jgi:hypothetical protein
LHYRVKKQTIHLRGGLKVLGIFGKVKDKERPATERNTFVLQGNEATSIKTTTEQKKEPLHTLHNLHYARKLNVNGVELYQLFTKNSREDILQECIKAEAIMRQLGSEAVFRTRVDFLGIPRLDQVKFKEALVDYLWTLYDLIDERVAIQSVT